MTRFAAALIVALVASLTLLTGCDGLFYGLHVAEGQANVQLNVEPITDVLVSGRLSDEEQAKLELIVAARDYAAETIGLSAGASYTQFYDTAGNPLAFNLSATRRDALEPVTWTFPIIGVVPYLAFFDEEYLNSIEQTLIDDGFDTLTYELDAYSTLGVFEDPVRSPMLRRNVISLADTIVHELVHNTIYRPNSTQFNESLAMYVGRQGSAEFLADYYGPNSPLPEIAREFNEDADATNAFLNEFIADLREYYAQPLSSEELIAGREAAFEAGRRMFINDVQPTLHYPNRYGGYATMPTNNAWVLARGRYNVRLDLFRDVYELVGREWPAAFEVYRAAANVESGPFEYLEAWIAERQAAGG